MMKKFKCIKILLFFSLVFSTYNAQSKDPSKTIILNKTQISQLLEPIIDAIQSATAVPVSKTEGKVNGFKIVKIKPKSFLNPMKIKEGDVLLNLNGIVIDGPKGMMAIIKECQKAEPFTLEVIRNNKSKLFLYKFKE